MKDNPIISDRTQKMEKLHWHIQHWKSDFQFMENEIAFIERLLNSHIFESNRPNLFERLQDFISRLDKLKALKFRLRQLISKYENRSGTVIGAKDEALVHSFSHRHDDLEMEVLECTDDFKKLKEEIFNFVGGTFKKREANAD